MVPREGPTYLIAVDTEVHAIPAGAADEVRTFKWGVLAASDPHAEVQRHLREALQAAGVDQGRIGHETSFGAVAPGHGAAEVLVPSDVAHSTLRRATPEATLVDAGPALIVARARKTPIEIAKLRRANSVAAFGLDAFSTLYEPGRSEAEVAAQVEAAIMSRGIGYEGATHARGWAQLMTGSACARAYTPHPATSDRVIQRGDLGVLELATVVDGYWSDLTRTLVAGTQPGTQQEELYGAILAAHGAVLQSAQPGMTGSEVDALARAEIEQRGRGELFVHHTGHGLGFCYHEPRPFLHPANHEIVEEGMVSSIEPGLYLEGFGGLRLEDNVVFTESGLELISHFNSALAR